VNFWEAVIIIVAIVAVVRIVQAKYGINGSRDGAPVRPADDVQARALRDEVRMLKERIAVLERLATDNNRALDLDREIEKLR
jgi:acyl dehydratase